MKLAIYDFDGTYVSIQTLGKLYELWKERRLNDEAYRKAWRKIVFRYILHKLRLFGWNKLRFNPYTMKQTANLFASVEYRELDRFLIDNYERLKAHVSATMKKQLARDRKEGYHTVLLSGNLDLILAPFKKDGFDTVIGTAAMSEGRLRSFDEVEVVIGTGKAEAIREAFPAADLAKSKAYADNGYDIPVLEIVGEPIAVDPDRALERHAERHGWRIIRT
ncbi:MAG: HAD family hydrolase [Acholeplasmataceae bacterium]